MAFDSIPSRQPAHWIARPRAAVYLLVLCMALGVTALEKWRPGAVEPVRHGVFVLLARYFQPVREATRAAAHLTRRTSNLIRLEKDYQALQSRLVGAEAELQYARERIRRFDRISGLRQWHSPEELEFLLADVIGFGADDGSAWLVINRGELDGVETGLPVVGQHGLAGVIREISDHSSRVQTLTDSMSAVGATLMQSRARGMIFGRGRSHTLEFIPENESQPIAIGAKLITSGLENSVYPKGLYAGEITALGFNEQGVRYGVVAPAENFSALEEVLVIRRAGFTSGRHGEGLSTFTFEMPTTTTLANDALSLLKLTSEESTSPSLTMLDLSWLDATAPMTPVPTPVHAPSPTEPAMTSHPGVPWTTQTLLAQEATRDMLKPTTPALTLLPVGMTSMTLGADLPATTTWTLRRGDADQINSFWFRN